MYNETNSTEGFEGFWAGMGKFFGSNLGQAVVGIGTTAAGVAITNALAPDPPKQSGGPAPATGGTYGAPPAGAPQVIVVEQPAQTQPKESAAQQFAQYIPYVLLGLAVLKFIKSK